MSKRVFLTVLDSLGIGELPDAADFGDRGANTLKSISRSERFSIPNLMSLGISNIKGVDYLKPSPLNCAVGRAAEKSRGKDTTIGHWELSGLISTEPLPTFPDGFPEELISEFEKAVGRKTVCNKPYSGTKVIADYGDHHVKTGDLIIYTSADSVFQIAAHEDVVPPETLYEYCRTARKLLTGKYGVGRVIARPFVGDSKNGFTRTSNRHDFSLEPHGRTMLDAISERGMTVYAIGKINDIFAGKGITEKVYTGSNAEGIELSAKALEKDFEGLCFTNLVDFDSKYGHRNNVDGYAEALCEFDKSLPSFISYMKDDDLLIITADHGCDPGDVSTDHTREYIPLLIVGKKVRPVDLGTRSTFADVAATVCEYLGVDFECDGKSFLSEIGVQS